MLLGEEPYVEPLKLQCRTLRAADKQQWITQKVIFFLESDI